MITKERRKGFAALGISVLDSTENQDQQDIKFRGHRLSEASQEQDFESSVLKERNKAQAKLLAIVAGLQEGVEDLLAGRRFQPKKDEDEEVYSESESSTSETRAGTTRRQSLAVPPQEEEQAAGVQPEEVKYSLRKSLAGMPVWMENQVVSEDEDEENASAEEGASEDESVGSFLQIAQYDIDDLVQETDEQKLQQQVGWGRAMTNRIMYEWKEYARVRLLEEVNQWFQHHSWAAPDEVEQLDNREAQNQELLGSQHESVRWLKNAIDSKDIALVSGVSSFRQNMDRRIEQHWEAKREARDRAIAQVQKEEELRRQERLKRQQERAAKKFSDIDDQIADLKDNIEQVKGEIHKKELMKHQYPSHKRRTSTAGASQASDVLAIIASQQEEAQVLQSKLALAGQKLETWEDAVEKGKFFFTSSAFKSRKLRNLPADDPAGEIVNEEMVSSMKQVLAQLMFEDDSLAELISVAISLANSPAGKNRTRNGFLRLDDIFGDQEMQLGDERLQSDEIVVSNDPAERKRKKQEIEEECERLKEEIEILSGVDHIVAEGAPPEPEESEEEEVKVSELDEAFGKLLSKGMAALEAMRQKKACLMQSKKKNEGESATEGEAEPVFDAPKVEEKPSEELEAAMQEMEQQKVMAAKLSDEEASLKARLKQLRAAPKVEALASPTPGFEAEVEESESESEQSAEGQSGSSASSASAGSRSAEAQLSQQLEENKAVQGEIEDLRRQVDALKSLVERVPEPGPKAEIEPVASPTQRMVQSPASPTSPRTPRGRKKSLASPKRSLKEAKSDAKVEEETEEQKEQNKMKLKDLIRDCQKLAEEKEAYEKEIAGIEEKVRRAKSMDSGGVVELLKKDVQTEKKVENPEVKDLKAEIKKKQSQVNAMRRTWQVSISTNRKTLTQDEESQREVAKRFAHVLSFLRAAKVTDLANAAEKSGLVTSGKSEVVGRTASKFLNSIRKIEVAERRDGEGVPEAEQEEPMQPVASLPAKMPSMMPVDSMSSQVSPEGGLRQLELGTATGEHRKRGQMSDQYFFKLYFWDHQEEIILDYHQTIFGNFLEIANRPCESDWAPTCAVKPCCTESDNFRRFHELFFSRYKVKGCAVWREKNLPISWHGNGAGKWLYLLSLDQLALRCGPAANVTRARMPEQMMAELFERYEARSQASGNEWPGGFLTSVGVGNLIEEESTGELPAECRT